MASPTPPHEPYSSPTRLMGIINVTPDSFSDGGQFDSPEKALAHGRALVASGADILDIGAESTRPGADPVPAKTEWRRLEPVLKGLRRALPQVALSLDSRRPETIERALALGISYVNNVAGIAPPETLAKIAAARCPKGQPVSYIAMHLWQSPKNMMAAPLSADDALKEVGRFYQDAKEQLIAAGLKSEQIYYDPGIGFGKTDGGNLQLLRDCLYSPRRGKMVVGLSRKSFLGRLLGIAEPSERDAPSKMLELALLMAGVHAIRTHDIKTLHSLRTALMTP